MKQEAYFPINDNRSSRKISDEQLKKYQILATRAYEGRKFNEAERYYSIVLKINPDDYIAIFYKGMSIGWQTTLEKPRVEKAVQSLIEIQPLLPSDTKTYLNTHFCSVLYPLIVGHYGLSWDKYLDVEDWTDDNIGVLYDYRNTAQYIIGCIDEFKEILFSTNNGEVISEIGEYYCKACCNLCSYVFKYNSSTENYNDIEFVGLPAESKRRIIEKYEDMIFEVRKRNPDFRRIEDKSIYSQTFINRLSPPKDLQSDTVLLGKNLELGLLFDKRVDDKIREWEKLEQFLDHNPDKKEEYIRLHDQILARKRDGYHAKALYEKHRGRKARLKTKIETIDKEVVALKDEIIPLERKIFGRSKAKEEIFKKENRIKELCVERKNLSNLIELEKEKMDIIDERIYSIRAEYDKSKDRWEDFLKSLGFLPLHSKSPKATKGNHW